MQNQYGGFSMQDVMRIANSPAGKQLLAMLKSTDDAVLQQAAAQASAGDMEQAKSTLSALLSSPQVKQLMDELGRQK